MKGAKYIERVISLLKNPYIHYIRSIINDIKDDYAKPYDSNADYKTNLLYRCFYIALNPLICFYGTEKNLYFKEHKYLTENVKSQVNRLINAMRENVSKISCYNVMNIISEMIYLHTFMERFNIKPNISFMDFYLSDNKDPVTHKYFTDYVKTYIVRYVDMNTEVLFMCKMFDSCKNVSELLSNIHRRLCIINNIDVEYGYGNYHSNEKLIRDTIKKEYDLDISSKTFEYLVVNNPTDDEIKFMFSYNKIQPSANSVINKHGLLNKAVYNKRVLRKDILEKASIETLVELYETIENIKSRYALVKGVTPNKHMFWMIVEGSSDEENIRNIILVLKILIKKGVYFDIHEDKITYGENNNVLDIGSPEIMLLNNMSI